jgi:hypothetical protein
MAYLGPEVETLEVDDKGGVTLDDQLVNTKGASLNYVRWCVESLGPFCADKSSLKGED